MAHQSYAKTVLEKTLAIASAGDGKARSGDISSALFVQTRLEQKRLLNTLSDLTKAGRLQRISQGVYGPMPGNKQPDKREAMWRLLRMRRRVTINDMIEMAEVSRDYARQWLAMLVKHEVVKKVQQPGGIGVWVLLVDSREMPIHDDNAAKLRELRRKKKELITGKLDAIDTALAGVRQILQTMEEE